MNRIMSRYCDLEADKGLIKGFVARIAK